ncbi:rhodanese-like domain-containing protein [Thalassospira alkalitolerans]|uniref:rhodanese-like domain-containing protein n=1 Tax=Thalassospira alkalitolerans TaxID=1293890 RepID=UPI000A1DE4F2|nr:rhodanese-like domain-containing protein [Thalassospira alkalitolerans]|tara:strand:- start:40922 stop:41245 length:324 start_codon:yes stop_codon:yes gene_type:complete
MVRDLRCSELSASLEAADPIALVDVREDWEVEICAIDGAHHIPLGDLMGRVGELDPESPVALLCHHGVRSRHAAIMLEDRGFKHVFNVAGGIDVWALEIDPEMIRYD